MHLCRSACFPPTPAPTAFGPADTDCMRWGKITNGQAPPKTDNFAPLYVGHQICSKEGARTAGATQVGVMGMQVCMMLDGKEVGHSNVYSDAVNGFDAKCRKNQPAYACWVPPHTGMQSYWVASFGSTNLTWTVYKKGDPIPTNAVSLNGLLLGQHDGANKFGDQNVMPGWITPEGGKLGSMKLEDYGVQSKDSFHLATCHPPVFKPFTCSDGDKCVNVDKPKGTAGTFASLEACAAVCKHKWAPPRAITGSPTGTKAPTMVPTAATTKAPTKAPTTKAPTTKAPTKAPTTAATKRPTKRPTKLRSTRKPTKKPTKRPTTKTPTKTRTRYCKACTSYGYLQQGKSKYCQESAAGPSPGKCYSTNNCVHRDYICTFTTNPCVSSPCQHGVITAAATRGPTRPGSPTRRRAPGGACSA